MYLSDGDCTAIGNYIRIVTSMLNGISTPSENGRLFEIFSRLKQKGSSQRSCEYHIYFGREPPTAVANIPRRFAPQSVEGTYGCGTDAAIRIYSMGVVRTRAFF